VGIAVTCNEAFENFIWCLGSEWCHRGAIWPAIHARQ